MTTTWSLTAGQLVTQAYRKIGNLTPPWTPSADQMNQGIIALNAMLKGWQTNGVNLYRQTQIAMNIGAGQGLPSTIGTPYQVTPLILSLEDARLVIEPAPNLYERPLAIYSYADYMNLPNKMASNDSGPSVIVFDRQATVSNIYIWPLATNGCTINATVGRTVNDVNTASDPLDFPSEWTEGAIFSLADRLMNDSGVRSADPVTAQDITLHASLFMQKLLDFDRPDSVFIRPWGRKGSGKFWR